MYIGLKPVSFKLTEYEPSKVEICVEIDVIFSPRGRNT